MKHLQFRLATILIVMAFAGVLLWANVRQRISISNSPAAFGLPSMISIRVSSGWPLSNWTSYLFLNDEAKEFIAKYPESAGEYRHRADPRKIAANIGIGCFLILIVAVSSEWLLRRSRPKPAV